jgi:hypothetical protein
MVNHVNGIVSNFQVCFHYSTRFLAGIQEPDPDSRSMEINWQMAAYIQADVSKTEISTAAIIVALFITPMQTLRPG